MSETARPRKWPGPTNPVICRRPSGRSLNSLAVPAVMLKKLSAGSPSSMKHWPGRRLGHHRDGRKPCEVGIVDGIAHTELARLAGGARVDRALRIENDANVQAAPRSSTPSRASRLAPAD